MIVTFSTENTDPEPMNFIVTGGCGFIGSHLVETVVMMGQNVLVIDDMRNGKTIFKDNPHIKYVHQDVCSVQPTIKEGKFNLKQFSISSLQIAYAAVALVMFISSLFFIFSKIDSVPNRSKLS